MMHDNEEDFHDYELIAPSNLMILQNKELQPAQS